MPIEKRSREKGDINFIRIWKTSSLPGSRAFGLLRVSFINQTELNRIAVPRILDAAPAGAKRKEIKREKTGEKRGAFGPPLGRRKGVRLPIEPEFVIWE